MRRSSVRSERITMVLSTLVAAAILGAAVTAQHDQPATPSELARLESDLRLQLDFAFRHDADKHDERIRQLNSAIAAWLQSPQSTEDDQLFIQWLQASIRLSMPGSKQPLPALPRFNNNVAVQDVEAATKTTPAETTPADTTPVKITPVEVAPVEGSPIEVSPVEGQSEKTAAKVHQADMRVELLVSPKDDRIIADNPIPANDSTHSQWEVPTKGVPISVSAPIATSSRDEIQRSIVSPRVTSILSQSQPAEVHVNLAELSARIAGYHDGLDEVEVALFHLPEQGIPAADQPLRQLQKLVRNYRFVKMYYDTLDEDERWAVAAPRSPVAVCQQFSKCLDKLANSSSDGDFLRPYDVNDSAEGNHDLRKIRERLLAVLNRIED